MGSLKDYVYGHLRPVLLLEPALCMCRREGRPIGTKRLYQQTAKKRERHSFPSPRLPPLPMNLRTPPRPRVGPPSPRAPAAPEPPAADRIPAAEAPHTSSITRATAHPRSSAPPAIQRHTSVASEPRGARLSHHPWAGPWGRRRYPEASPGAAGRVHGCAAAAATRDPRPAPRIRGRTSGNAPRREERTAPSPEAPPLAH